MTLLDRLSRRESWESFYTYKNSLTGSTQFCKELRGLIDSGGYISVCDRIKRGGDFPLPRRAVISKLDTQKKRVVYTYPAAENMVLKLLTHLILRKYDGLFCEGLYSFRPNRTAKDAIRRLTGELGIDGMYSYKADISNYFNSVPTDRLLVMLERVIPDDPELYSFLRRLLAEPRVLDGSRIITEEKGIMAGTPLSAFYANLYLSELDSYFIGKDIPYGRYSDDIILFAPSEQQRDEYADFLRSFISQRGLIINPAKESLTAPGEEWTFLGFSYKNGITDIAPVSVMKMKNKMRRKARALQRWRERNELSGEKAAMAFIRIFNRKFFECTENSDLTWSRWFFPVIDTDESLRVIDNYAQDCVRFLVSGKRTKSRFNVRYEQIRSLGLRSLVHEYYRQE